MQIQDSVALVTGANRGIGKAFVDALIARGARKVYAAARDVTKLPTFESRVEAVALDVTDASSVRDATSAAADVNLLINNAGVLSFGDILSVTEEDIERDFAVNFYGALRTARSFTPVIENRNGGAIVNILTLLSFASMPGMAAYNASKAAAWSMHLSLRATLAGRGIDVHGVFPGAVDTDMLRGIEMPKTSPADIANAVLTGVEKGEEDIFPDPMSTEIYAAWSRDHKAVEKQFAQM